MEDQAYFTRKNKTNNNIVLFVLLLSLVITTEETVAETDLDDCVERIAKILLAGLLPDLTYCEFPMEFAELARAGGVDIQMHINNFSEYISFTECDLEVFCNFFRVLVVLLVHSKELELPKKYAGKMPWETPDFMSEYNTRIKVQTNIPSKVYHGSGEQRSTSKNSYSMLKFGCYLLLLLLGCVFCAAIVVLIAPAAGVDHGVVPVQEIDAAGAEGHQNYRAFYIYGAVASALGLVIFLIHLLHQKYFKH